MGVNVIGVCRFDDIMAGYFQIVTGVAILASGRVYPAGSVIGKASDGRCCLVDSSATDGTEVVYGVLPEEVNALDADTEATVNLTGEYNRNRVTFAEGTTWEDCFDAARRLCIFFKEPAPKA